MTGSRLRGCLAGRRPRGCTAPRSTKRPPMASRAHPSAPSAERGARGRLAESGPPKTHFYERRINGCRAAPYIRCSAYRAAIAGCVGHRADRASQAAGLLTRAASPATNAGNARINGINVARMGHGVTVGRRGGSVTPVAAQGNPPVTRDRPRSLGRSVARSREPCGHRCLSGHPSEIRRRTQKEIRRLHRPADLSAAEPATALAERPVEPGIGVVGPWVYTAER